VLVYCIIIIIIVESESAPVSDKTWEKLCKKNDGKDFFED